MAEAGEEGGGNAICSQARQLVETKDAPECLVMRDVTGWNNKRNKMREKAVSCASSYGPLIAWQAQPSPSPPRTPPPLQEIGRASCRERVFNWV